MMTKIKIVFMGTPDFSVPTLEKLYNDKNIEIGYVVTKTDSKSSRGQKINFSYVKKKAIELNLNILQPEKIRNDIEVINKLKIYKPDFIIVVAYGQILSKEILDIPNKACINGHASLLPKYRGASPIQSAILAGDNITGTTSMLMEEGLDTGDILKQVTVTIDKKETSDSLFEKLSHITADTIYHTILDFDNITPIKQNNIEATKSAIIKKEYGYIDFANENVDEIDRKIRAYTSWPSAYIVAKDIIYKIWDVDRVENNINFDFGKKFTDNIFIIGDKLIAKCNDGYLSINEIQKSGKNKMKAKDFINGIK